MLETKKLCKIYRPKKGVPVRALDGVSLKLPARGMVFLLGKSGSGKSTLLNVLGGLDRYDSGEILIKGVSSKSFKQQDFDTYRNTYVGFIFQEYNVLEDFSVGANIALAIELQGRRADDAEINRILHEVDLDGYGNRKPNELSGGQKQRVAIARALIKNPEIIMADEPTGALDSATGRAVLDTLKRLSADKLVVVVSHDREFAEQYADRIIELSDGKIISDMEYAVDATAETAVNEAQGMRFTDVGIEISSDYRLSEEDRLAINRYLDALSDGNVTLRLMTSHKENATKRSAQPTDQTKIPAGDPKTFRRIKSRLPLKDAFRIGSGALAHKKFRLAVTIFLSCIAFMLFGLADTFSAYDHIRTCSRSLVDSNITYASLTKSVLLSDGKNYSSSMYMSDVDIEQLRQDTGMAFHGVYASYRNEGMTDSFAKQFDGSSDAFPNDSSYLFASRFVGVAEMDAAGLSELGYSLIAGEMPRGDKNEIAISSYVLESFLRGGYCEDPDNGTTAVYVPINTAQDMIGKTLRLGEVRYTVTGVFDDGMDLDRYLTLADMNSAEGADLVLAFALNQEFNAAKQYSYAQVIWVGRGFLNEYRTAIARQGHNIYDYGSISLEKFDDTTSVYVNPSRMLSLSHVRTESMLWFNEGQTSLGEKQLLISSDLLWELVPEWDWSSITSTEDLRAKLRLLAAEGVFDDMSLSSYYWQVTAELTDSLYEDGWSIVGVVNVSVGEDAASGDSFFVCDALYNQISAIAGDGIYSFAVAPMPRESADIQKLVAFCYAEGAETRYPMQNAVTFELDVFDVLLDVLADVFLYIGIGFALFAALMLANFIGTSVAYKKQEIGILRAIGSRSNDVFRIFFAEAFIIAMINFVLSALGTGLITVAINNAFRSQIGILITILSFGVRQIALLLLISIVVAAIASFVPVRRIAAKRPIDAIRNR